MVRSLSCCHPPCPGPPSCITSLCYMSQDQHSTLEGWTIVRRTRWQPPKSNRRSFNHRASHTPPDSATARPRPQHHPHGTHLEEIETPVAHMKPAVNAAHLTPYSKLQATQLPSSLILSTSSVPTPPRFNAHHHPSPPPLIPTLTPLYPRPPLSIGPPNRPSVGCLVSTKVATLRRRLQPPFPGPATFDGRLPPSISLPYLSTVDFSHYCLLPLSPPVSSRLPASEHLSIPNHCQPFSSLSPPSPQQASGAVLLSSNSRQSMDSLDPRHPCPAVGVEHLPFVL
ncbi:hypothetical protein AMTRI_Chr11g153610 [Amborella trichopoda]